jgi:hypothetical protein
VAHVFHEPMPRLGIAEEKQPVFAWRTDELLGMVLVEP